MSSHKNNTSASTNTGEPKVTRQTFLQYVLVAIGSLALSSPLAQLLSRRGSDSVGGGYGSMPYGGRHL